MTTRNRRPNKGQIDQFFDYSVLIPARTIYIGGEIESPSTDCVIKALHALKALNSRKQITMVINTTGGNEYDAWAIYDTAKNLKVPIRTVAQGACMSAGTIIFLAGGIRLIAPNCVFMVHDGSDCNIGERKNVERWAEFGKKYRTYAYKIYYEVMKKANKKITMKDVEHLCLLDTILTAKEAVEKGFATGIL